MLALYLKRMNANGEHDFAIEGHDALLVGPGIWDQFSSSAQRRAQLKANRLSYLWDYLIEKFGFHSMTGTQYFNVGGTTFKEQEAAFRFLARETRMARRGLSSILIDLLHKSVAGKSLNVRTVTPLYVDGPVYVFLLLRWPDGIPQNKYRELRKRLLLHYCEMAKVKFSKALDIVGIAMEAGFGRRRSEDYVYFDGRQWTPEIENQAKENHAELGFSNEIEARSFRITEYPDDAADEAAPMEPLARNSPCYCNSGRRYKRCHGQKPACKKSRRSRHD